MQVGAPSTRLVGSLLDRLTIGKVASAYQTLDGFLESVTRDVECLLNTRAEASKTAGADDGEEYGPYPWDYGLPDLSAYTLSKKEHRQTIGEHIRHALESWEPRLLNVQVEPSKQDNGRLHFRIKAQIRIQPSPRPVILDSHLDSTSHQFAVTMTRGAD